MQALFWVGIALGCYCLIGRMLESLDVKAHNRVLWPLYAAGIVFVLGTLPLWFLPAFAYWIYWRNKTLGQRQDKRWAEERPRLAARNRQLAEESRTRAKRYINANHFSSAAIEECNAANFDALAVLWETESDIPEVNRTLYDAAR